MKGNLPNRVMLNAYPDSIDGDLAGMVRMLQRPEFTDVFGLFYVLPSIFNSDLDRGFSIIDYDLNAEPRVGNRSRGPRRARHPVEVRPRAQPSLGGIATVPGHVGER